MLITNLNSIEKTLFKYLDYRFYLFQIIKELKNEHSVQDNKAYKILESNTGESCSCKCSTASDASSSREP